MALTMTPQNCPMVNGQKMTMTIDTLSFPHGQQTIYRHFVIEIHGKIFCYIHGQNLDHLTSVIWKISTMVRVKNF